MDLHLVIPALDRTAYAKIVAAAECSLLSSRAQGSSWRLELRHGPFKPVPGAGEVQLHLIIDDMGSLELSPWVLRLYRAATSYYLLGAPGCPPAPARVGCAKRGGNCCGGAMP